MNRTLVAVGCVDSSGAGGIAGDLKTFQAYRVYGAAVVTGICAQNTCGVQAAQPVAMEMVGQQLEAVAADMKVHGVKVGALLTAANAQIVASLIEALGLQSAVVVVDPVMAASTGERLLEEGALEVYRRQLLRLATVVTPNRREAEALTGKSIADLAGAKEAAAAIHGLGPKHVIVTAGDMPTPRAVDVWYDGTSYHLFDSARLPSQNVLGVGTAFSAALCALLVKGLGVGEAAERARKYVTGAMQHPFKIGAGKGPLNHAAPI